MCAHRAGEAGWPMRGRGSRARARVVSLGMVEGSRQVNNPTQGSLRAEGRSKRPRLWNGRSGHAEASTRVDGTVVVPLRGEEWLNGA